MKPDFSIRSAQSELMDTEKCTFEDFRACLRDLATVNSLTLAYRPTLQWFERLYRQGRLSGGKPIRIVDVGSGYGDMLRRVSTWAAKRGVTLQCTGVDMNPWSAKAAAAVKTAGAIDWVTANAFSFMPESGADIVICSLFTHHLSDAENVALVKWMERVTTIGWFINDLHRHLLPYYVFRGAVALSSFHRFVKHDGPVSIARSFIKKDWREILKQADVSARIEWRFPFRLCVGRVKPYAV
jgi:ubiquinone/menaquinone biosynthesis C-methylase UbiE